MDGWMDLSVCVWVCFIFVLKSACIATRFSFNVSFCSINHNHVLQIEDEGVLRLLYEEAKHNIIAGRYPCDPEHWASLGALSLALDEGTGLERQKLTSAIR